MTARVLVLLPLAVTACPLTARAEDECGKAGAGQPCSIIIDRTAPVSGRAVSVENETNVRILLIKKSPFESCRNDVKREELPEVSAIPALLDLARSIAPSLALLNVNRDQLARSAAVGSPERIELLLDAVSTAANAQMDVLDGLRKRYEVETAKLTAFYGTAYFQKRRRPDARNDEAAFEADRRARERAVDALAGEQVPTAAEGELTFKSVLSDYTAYTRSSAVNPALVPVLEQQINRARMMLDAVGKAAVALEAAHVRLGATLTYLKTLENPEWEVALQLRPDRNVRVTGSFACTSDVTGKATLDPPVVYSVRFQNTPRMSLTAGILVSALPRNRIGIEAVADRAPGALTTHSEIRDHPTRPQAVPFTFINVRVGGPIYWNGRVVTVNVAPGLGVNTNNGGTHAEFFLGASVGIGSLFLAAGGHAGHELRPANGFALLDRPPDDVNVVPVETRWKLGAAVAISYRIPLK